MGIFKYLHKTWKSPELEKLFKERLISWRKEPVFQRIERPTRLDRAHSLGYKAKQGFVLVRTRIKKGTRKREGGIKGKKPAQMGKTKHSPKMNLQHIAEARVGKKYINMEVLNSYYVAEDGQRIWYEVILIDPEHPCIKNDKRFEWINNPANRGRVFRGLTSAGKKSRGLRRKGKGAEKIRPSRYARFRHKENKERK
ncbi:MAG: 50S ribosomal protein L15e [Candidatus Aenigmarchaeota archaeon]|nr:50S ribosomal protein L15e [Candidatus Aenigmarchaeota archaeon]